SELAAAHNMSCADLADKMATSMRHALEDQVRVDNYVAHLDGDYLMAPYSKPAHREQWQAARLNHAANSYRKDLPNDILTVQSMKDYGFERLMKRDYVGAEGFFKAALSTNGNNERARYGLGIAQMKQGKFENAMQNLGIAKFLEPDDAQVHIAIGQLLEAQGQDAAAIESYQTASRLQPENPEPALYVADMREERDQISRSSAELNEAQANCPSSEYIRLRKKDQVAWRLARPY
ncbi:MAG: tetratricopeptide repeat protein, partial [Candidatus Obscuribacterales bacterium]|nr:tetratricopeptide repeat protein [Candidatus Obscuribacterales bacterium]